MNKKDWRDRLLTIRAWNADTTKNFSSELDDVLNLALQRIASDVPGAVIPDMDYVVVDEDYTQTDFGRGVSTTSDTLVLSFCRERMKWGKPRPSIPSRFLMEMRGETERAKRAAAAPAA